MKKVILQGLSLPVLFLATWFLLTQVDWVTLLNVQKITDTTEKKLGKVFSEVFQTNEISDSVIVNTVDSIVTQLCETNDIDRSVIKLHVVTKDEVNAFALPDGHLVVYTGLILHSENAEVLSGVIAHEIAHIQLKHVMKKLMKEVGLSVLISMTSGQGGDMVKETAKKLSSTAFDRGLEKEADLKAVDFLTNAKINPEPFAQFLYTLGDEETLHYFTWISTHPDSKERAAYILEYAKGIKENYKPVLDSVSWNQLQLHLEE